MRVNVTAQTVKSNYERLHNVEHTYMRYTWLAADKRDKSGRFAKTSNLRNCYNRLINITTPLFLEFMTRLVCSENGLHASIASSRADFFTSKSLSKDFYNSLSAQKFLIEISDKTKGIDLALEGLSNWSWTLTLSSDSTNLILLRFWFTLE